MTELGYSKPADVVVRGNATGFLQEVVSGNHHLSADEPASVNGTGAAPGPYDYLLIALGACTSMTAGLYARRKQFPLQNITVSLWHSRIHAQDCEECETKEGMLDRIDTQIELTGPLTAEQRAKLIEIAGKCPVHRTLKSEIDIRLRSALAEGKKSMKIGTKSADSGAMSASLTHAPNLNKRPPRSPRVRLGGYVVLPRILDKGRAELAGTAGEFKYNNPADYHWFRFTGITPEALKAELATGKGDGEMLAWVERTASHKRTPWEIEQWSAYFSERGPDGDVETLELFAKRVGEFNRNREDVKTWFDLLDLDDYVTFGGSP